MRRIEQIMQAKYPDSDLSRYFAFLAAVKGTDHDHHIAPRAEFSELVDDRENIISLSFQEHFYAHYLLALAVPECSPYQTTVCFMANVFAHELRTDELPFFAEVYERGMRAMKIANGTPEARARNSAAIKKRYENPEARAHTSAAMKKRFEDPEARARNSVAQKLCKNTPEARARQSAAIKKRFEDPEARARNSAAQKIAQGTPEARARHSAAMKKRFEDPEARARNSAAQKLCKNTPEARARQSAAIKKRYENPEARARTSAAIKKHWAKRKAERLLADALISTVHDAEDITSTRRRE